ncbi:MAG: aminopeptidase, partial [Candidatus Hydrothermarchaeales archaeon]
MTLSDTFKICLDIKKGETVLLLTDTEMGKVAGIIKDAVESLPGELVFVFMPPREIHGEEPPRAVASAMESSDVVIAATSKSLTHTQATKNAVKHGTRVASMPGITIEMLTNGGMTADYREVAEAARRVAEVLTQGRTIEIKTSAGTDFKTSIYRREGYADTGLLTKKGDFGNLPGGEGFIAPLEGKSEGRIVFDGPIASSGLFHAPLVVEVEN